MFSVALSVLVLMRNILEETYFCYLHAYLLAYFYEIHLKFLKSLFSLRRFRTVETIPICKSRDDGTNMRTVEPQVIPIKVCVMFYNTEICCGDCGEKKASFLAII